jgi:hypothetical protein
MVIPWWLANHLGMERGKDERSTSHALRNRVMLLPSHKAERQALHPPKTPQYGEILGNILGTETGKALVSD